MIDSLTMREIVSLLKTRGYEVEIYIRNDGGIRITKINGQYFSGSRGNIFGRSVVGANLSEARKIQLESIRTPKGKFGHKKLEPLSKADLSMIRKAQREWKKGNVKGSGLPGRRGFRYVMQKYGAKEARRLLGESIRYSQGLAYTANVEALILRIEHDLKINYNDDMQEVVNMIRQRLYTFKESWINPIYDIVYQWEQGVITGEECARRIKLIIQ